MKNLFAAIFCIAVFGFAGAGIAFCVDKFVAEKGSSDDKFDDEIIDAVLKIDLLEGKISQLENFQKLHLMYLNALAGQEANPDIAAEVLRSTKISANVWSDFKWDPYAGYRKQLLQQDFDKRLQNINYEQFKETLGK